ncbi:putative RING finger domain-containing protein [Tetraselmis virus 1]|uniref:Putative RING finger domain-containing protein n=1 Tax=Tetraselmis virus 1 TaxID=2060617 RepID=A0A2P0VML0_9VIRU|nr:putative RING finger domain-containing protein [Tetraselmis virus 1]AUF82134.1 putative RING finger domain-containing protein [Tetraselmis virus 1]
MLTEHKECIERIKISESYRDKNVLISPPGTGTEEILRSYVSLSGGLNVIVITHAIVTEFSNFIREVIPNTVTIYKFGQLHEIYYSLNNGSNTTIIISDKMIKYYVSYFTKSLDSLIYFYLEDLILPNSAEIKTKKLWILTADYYNLSLFPHRGFLKRTIEEMYNSSDKSFVYGCSYPVTINQRLVQTQVGYNDDQYSEMLVDSMLEKGFENIAIQLFPGDVLPESSINTQTLRESPECPICYEAVSCKSYTSCCKKIFCLNCLTKTLRYTDACPWCRSRLSLEDMTVIYDKPVPKKMSKLEVIQKIIESVTHDEGSKILIVTEPYMFDCIQTICTEEPVILNYGCPNRITKSLNLFKQASSKIIIANNEKYSSGLLDLRGITHVLFTNNYSLDTRNKWMSTTGVFLHHSQRPDSLWGRKLVVYSLYSILEHAISLNKNCDCN